jgi:hypothetical protein
MAKKKVVEPKPDLIELRAAVLKAKQLWIAKTGEENKDNLGELIAWLTENA